MRSFLSTAAAATACLGALAALSAHAAPTAATTPTLATRADQVTGQEWDYVIIGGGLTGLVVANRLSENPNVSVLVIEAGDDTRNDYRVKTLRTYGQAFNSPLSWQFQSSMQYGGTSKRINGGKGLGGSTSINGAAWTRGAKEQYDLLEQLGNPGWNWDGILQGMMKSEKFHGPDEQQQARGAGMQTGIHGLSGPVDVAYTPVNANAQRRKRMYTDEYGPKYLEAAQNSMGLRRIDDIGSGDIHGVGATTPNTIMPGSANQLRVSSATAYLNPIENARSNLRVLTGWQGIRATYDPADPLRVNGVVFQKRVDGPSKQVKAKKAVILAAGALRTPSFLELSGIGDRRILAPLGIKSVVDLPSVGTGLIDQTMNTIGAAPGSSFQGSGPSSTIAFPNIYQLMPNATVVRKDLEANLDAYAAQTVQAGGAINANAIKAQWSGMISDIWDRNVSVSELFLDHGFPSGQLGQDVWQLTTFSRGSCHITSKNAFAPAKIDPGYFRLPVDMDLTIASLRAARKVYQTSPLKETLQGERTPGFDRVPDDAAGGSYGAWRAWVTRGYAPVAHQIGTCAMADQRLGGCVDPAGRVYGISKGSLRVVDGSTLPYQLSAHLSATLYGMAERFAEAIIADQ